ncbi:outer membrane protein assembly factor BamE [Marinospirillum sp. MEB164]|uniref:Outer membrane protein assembly factor BamE n=1 Tax=Marinospirillum alkalitolerans TaxID=3123374 RepID=A0ABW8PVC8_9GAMM
MKNPTKLLTFVFFALFLSGCGLFSPFQQEIQQGNLLDQDDVAQLREGMTAEQVTFLLGSPLLRDPERPLEWHYIEQKRVGRALVHRHEVRLVFTQQQGQLRVASIETTRLTNQ